MYSDAQMNSSVI